tara:strand:- start:590 stop:1516 length:927 start_codon:yes stop_codon:yes gene_type:complete
MKKFSILTLYLVSFLVIFGCSNVSDSESKVDAELTDSVSTTFPLDIIDGYGKTFTFEKSPERIIVIDSAAVEILYDLGAEDRILATHDFVNYPPLVTEVPRIGNAFALNYEKIVSLEPDLIYIFFDGPYEDLVALDIPVLYIESPTTLEGVAERIKLWGTIINKKNAGEKSSNDFLQSLSKIESKISDVESFPSVYHDVSPDWWTSGSGTLAYEMFDRLKARNIFDDIEGWSQVSVEQIVDRNPQFVLSVYPEGREMLLTTEALRSVDAIRNQKILTIEGDLIAIEGPRLINGMTTIAEFLYPDIYRE